MAEQAAHLGDRVLRRAPYRQWGLTLPWELARAVAFDADLCSRVFAIFADEVGGWQCARARAMGIASPQAGAILEIQRFADGMTLFVHGHLLAPDGVFDEAPDGLVRWRGIGPPTDQAVKTVVLRVTERVGQLLERRARAAADDDPGLEPEHPILLQCADARPSGGGAGGARSRRGAWGRRGSAPLPRRPYPSMGDQGATDDATTFGPRRVILGRGHSLHLDGLSMECTHMGCDVDWSQKDQLFVCPCHGSRFDAQGAVKEAPADEPLRQYAVTKADGQVIIEL